MDNYQPGSPHIHPHADAQNEVSSRVLAIQVVAQPKDVNAAGDIFGGWLVSQMDLAGAIMAQRLAQSRVATVAIDHMVFKAPVAVGDVVSCYTTLLKIGNTSLRINIEVFTTPQVAQSPQEAKAVASGHFTFVALDKKGRPKAVRQDLSEKGKGAIDAAIKT